MLTATNIFNVAIYIHLKMHKKFPTLRERRRAVIWFLYRLEFPDPLDLYVVKFQNALSSLIFIRSTLILIRYTFYDNLRIAIYKFKKYCKMSKCEHFFSRL